MTGRRLAHVLGVLLLIGLVAPFVVYAVPQTVGGDYGFVVLSGSMEPAMSPGDAIIVRDVPASTVEQGDIITFKRAGMDTPTTHRVDRVTQTENGVAFKTKGDANEEVDMGLVRPPNLAGKVVLIIPFVGYVIHFANSRTGFALLVLGPLGLFVVSELWTFLGLSLPGLSRTDDGDVDHGVETETADSTTATATDGTNEASEGAAATKTDGGAGVQAADDGDSTIVITRSSVLFVLGLFLVYAPYSGYVAFRIRELWALIVAIASGISLLFVLGLYLTLGSDGAGPAKAVDSGSDAGGETTAGGDSPRLSTDGQGPTDGGEFDADATTDADGDGGDARFDADESPGGSP